jgi:hypothetical protein
MSARTPFPRRLKTLFLTAVLTLAAAAPAAHAADPTWHAVAPPIEDFPNSAFALTFDPLGTVFAAWTNPGAARLATRPGAGMFGTPIAFPTSTGVASVFGFAANGEGVFIGTDGTTVRAATRAAGPDGAFGPVQTVGGGGFPAVAVNASGQALAAWAAASFSATPLVVAVRPAGGGFATESLAGAGSPRAVGFALTGAALDADGSGVVAYLDETNVLRVVTRSEGGSWSGPAQISAVPVSGVAALASNTAGDAVVVWNEGETVRAALRPHDGAFGAAQTVAQVGGIDRLRAFSVAIAADGTPFAALDRDTSARRICGDTVFQIDTAELWRGSGGGWTSVVRQEGQRPVVATSRTGDRLAFAWEGFVDPCAVLNTHAIRVQLGTVAGLGADTLMAGQPAEPTFGNTNTAQSVAVDGAGNTIVTWSATRPETGGGTKTRVAAFDTGSAPPGGGGGGGGGSGGGGGTPPGEGGSGGGDGGGGGNPPPTDPNSIFTNLLGLRAPVRRIPLDLDGSLPASVTVDARCLARRGTCRVNVNPTLGGSYSPASASAAARRGRRARTVRFSIALPRVHATIRAGRSARLKIAIRGRALAKARAALRAGGTVKLTIAMTVNGTPKPKPIAIPLVAKRAARGRRR